MRVTMAPSESAVISERLSTAIDDVEITRREIQQVDRAGPSEELRIWPGADPTGTRLHAELIRGFDDRGNGGDSEGNGNGSGSPTAESCWGAYRKFADRIDALVDDERWAEKPIAEELRTETSRLGDLMEADPELHDEGWLIRDSLDQIEDLKEIMARKIEREALDDPAVALSFVARQLRRVETDGLARILGVSSEIAAHAQAGQSIRSEVEDLRATLVGQLVYDLRNSMTSGGIVLWFETDRYQLENRSPLALIDTDVRIAEKPLRSLARAGRGQLAT